METSQMDSQEKFLKSCKEKIDKKNGVQICLWKLSYSFMKLKIITKDYDFINENEIANIINDEMELETFNNLVINFKFKKAFVFKNKLFKNELSYKFEKNRDKNMPHGKVKIWASNYLYSYGKDAAGSTWRKFRLDFNQPWELVEWAED